MTSLIGTLRNCKNKHNQCEIEGLCSYLDMLDTGIGFYETFENFNKKIQTKDDIEEIRALSNTFLLTLEGVFFSQSGNIRQNLNAIQGREYKKIYNSNKGQIKKIKRFMDRIGAG